MTFKYNPLSGELNIFGVTPSKTPTEPDKPQEHTGSGFWYYLEKDTPVNFSSTNTFIPLPQLKESWNNTGVQLTNTNEYVIPTAGIWIWTLNTSVISSESSTLTATPYLQLNGSNLTAIGGTWTGITPFNKGDKLAAGFEVTFESGSQSSITLAKGILSTYFTVMLLTPAVNSSTNPSNKESHSSGNSHSGSPSNPNNHNPNSNTSGNTTNNSNSNQNNSGNTHSNKPLTNPLTNFTVSPTSPIGYTFEATNAGTPIIYNIYSWATSQGQHPLGNGTLTVPEEGTWSFSWTLPNYPQKDGFSLNIQVDVNGKPLALTSQFSVSAPLKKGDQVTFNIMGFFPNSAPASAQVNITLNPNDTSLTAHQGS